MAPRNRSFLEPQAVLSREGVPSGLPFLSRQGDQISQQSFDRGGFSTFLVDQVEVCDHPGQGPAMA